MHFALRGGENLKARRKTFPTVSSSCDRRFITSLPELRRVMEVKVVSTSVVAGKEERRVNVEYLPNCTPPLYKCQSHKTIDFIYEAFIVCFLCCGY